LELELAAAAEDVPEEADPFALAEVEVLDELAAEADTEDSPEEPVANEEEEF
jgi:hypothetical protein